MFDPINRFEQNQIEPPIIDDRLSDLMCFLGLSVPDVELGVRQLRTALTQHPQYGTAVTSELVLVESKSRVKSRLCRLRPRSLASQNQYIKFFKLI